MAGLSGMTGFGRAEGSIPGWTWVWEARAVNGRSLDVKLRLPPGYDSLDPLVRDGCKARFGRGSFQITLTLKRDSAEEGAALTVNQDLIDLLLAAGQARIARGEVSPPDWASLLHVRGVVTVTEDLMADDVRAALDSALQAGLNQALDGLKSARLAEGATLGSVFSGLFDEIASGHDAARAAAKGQTEALRDRVSKRAAELLGEVTIDQQRLAQEIALLAMKADVQEELERLAAHLADGRALLAEGGAIGRKLDFLAQELHREANTLTTKAATLELTRIGIGLKTTIDRLKEQAANAE